MCLSVHTYPLASFVYRSHCDCDETFRECLKNLTKIAGNFIGALFFGGSGVGCFRLDFPARCSDR